MDAIGFHCIVELYDCPPHLLDDVDHIDAAIRAAVKRSGADLIQQISHKFTPQGVTALGLLSESHISIHTWPERGYAAVDCYTCGTRCKPELACLHLAEALEADRHAFVKFTRGGETVTQVNDLADVADAEPEPAKPRAVV